MILKIFSIVSICLSVTSISLISIAPAEASLIKWTKNKLNNSGIIFRGTYAPPKLPVSASCDLNGNAYGSFSRGVRTPIGRFGVTATRKIKSFNCYGRLN